MDISNDRTILGPTWRGLRRRIATLAMATSLVGCGTVVPEPILIREPLPAPILLTVAVHYAEDFRSYEFPRSSCGSLWGSWAIGEPSVKLLDEALSTLFTGAVRSSAPGQPMDAAIAGRIHPTIASVSCWTPPGGIGKSPVRARADITYTFVLLSRDGQQVARWDIRARGADVADESGLEIARSSSSVKRAFELAMREAAFKLTSQFREVPGVETWLAEQGVK